MMLGSPDANAPPEALSQSSLALMEGTWRLRRRPGARFRRQHGERVGEGFDHQSHDAMRVPAVLRHAEFQARRHLLRNAQRAEHPVENRKEAAEIAIVMGGVDGMMDLVMGRAQDETAGQAAQRDPELRMLKIGEQKQKYDSKNVGAIDHVDAYVFANYVYEQTVGQA
jgi:hypothetical protein